MPVQTIGVIGAGVMGSGIAQIAAATGLSTVEGNFTRLAAKDKMTAAEKETGLKLIRGTTAYEDLKAADVVIEAAIENFNAKVKILQRVDGLINAETIVASNTSSISITKLAAAMSHPERVIGMHFFNPVPIMAL